MAMGVCNYLDFNVTRCMYVLFEVDLIGAKMCQSLFLCLLKYFW